VKQDPEKEVDIALLWGVWRLLMRHYISPSELKTDEMVYGAVSGLVSAVGDPYTAFMTPKDTKEFDDSLAGTLEGIGAQLDLRSGQVVVVAPLKGSPADKAGLQPQDIILSANDKDLNGLSLEDVVGLIRGPKGSTVKLLIFRKGASDPLTFTVVRDSIHIPSVESKTMQTPEGTIGVVTLNQFGDDSMAEMKKALEAFPKNLKGIVLDLRYNGGGYLDGAVELVSMFLQAGDVVTVHHRDQSPEGHQVTGKTIFPDTPLVVLINGGTASASEITAGALQDHKRATLVGTQSFGKGTVQELIDLPGGSTLRVTVAKWMTPSGHDLGKKGITPDIIISRSIDDVKADKDPQLDAAVSVLTGKKVESEKTGTGSVK
jgi:carboxyl-terminal processing protease